MKKLEAKNVYVPGNCYQPKTNSLTIPPNKGSNVNSTVLYTDTAQSARLSTIDLIFNTLDSISVPTNEDFNILADIFMSNFGSIYENKISKIGIWNDYKAIVIRILKAHAENANDINEIFVSYMTMLNCTVIADPVHTIDYDNMVEYTKYFYNRAFNIFDK